MPQDLLPLLERLPLCAPLASPPQAGIARLAASNVVLSNVIGQGLVRVKVLRTAKPATLVFLGPRRSGSGGKGAVAPVNGRGPRRLWSRQLRRRRFSFAHFSGGTQIQNAGQTSLPTLLGLHRRRGDGGRKLVLLQRRRGRRGCGGELCLQRPLWACMIAEVGLQ
jgi:hypothetical protein